MLIDENMLPLLHCAAVSSNRLQRRSTAVLPVTGDKINANVWQNRVDLTSGVAPIKQSLATTVAGKPRISAIKPLLF
jgi:hypothetical protein